MHLESCSSFWFNARSFLLMYQPTQMVKSMVAFRDPAWDFLSTTAKTTPSQSMWPSMRKTTGCSHSVAMSQTSDAFFPSLCSHLSWMHRSLCQPWFLYFPCGSDWRNLLSYYFTSSLITTETMVNKPLSGIKIYGYQMVPTPNALRLDLHR